MIRVWFDDLMVMPYSPGNGIIWLIPQSSFVLIEIDKREKEVDFVIDNHLLWYSICKK